MTTTTIRRRQGPGIDGGQRRRGSRVIAYIRVSDYKAGDQLSPEVQLQQIENLARREGLTIVAVPGLTETPYGDTPLIEDLDKSGRSSKKRRIGPIIDAIRRGEADGVAVWKISRWGRNLVDSLLNIHELHDTGGYVLSATENLNEIESSFGRFNLSQLLLIAQLQSDQIGETWANIHEFRLAHGKTPMGGPRWGYVRDRDADTYLIDESVQVHVRQCYRMYLDGIPFGAISDYLNAHDVRNIKGNKWTATAIVRTMDTGFAAGLVVRYGKRQASGAAVSNITKNTYVEGTHSAIIDAETWGRYLVARLKSISEDNRRTRTKHAWSKLLVCGTCRTRMTTQCRERKDGTRYVGWRCLRTCRKNYLDENRCPSPVHVSDRQVHDAVRDWVFAQASTKVDIRTMVAREQAGRKATGDIDKLRKEVARIEARRARAYELLLDGKIPDPSFYQKQDEEMAGQIRDLQSRIMEAEKTARVNAIPEATVFDAIASGFGRMKPESMNAALGQVIRRIEVYRVPRDGKRAEARVHIVPMWEE